MTFYRFFDFLKRFYVRTLGKRAFKLFSIENSVINFLEINNKFII
jgi:hypothetical protein